MVYILYAFSSLNMKANSFKRTNCELIQMRLISIEMSLNKCSEPHPCVWILVCSSICTRLCCVHGVRHVASSKSSELPLMRGKSGEAGGSSSGSLKRGSECFLHGSRRSQKEREAWKWDKLEEKERESQNTQGVPLCSLLDWELTPGHEVWGVSFCSHTLKDNERMLKDNERMHAWLQTD